MFDWSIVDKECVHLCKAINRISGIRTVESCSGHNKRKFRIQFFADSLEVLHSVAHWFCGSRHEFYGWEMIVEDMPEFSRSKCPLVFIIEGPIGAYDEADKIAEIIEREELGDIDDA